VTKLYVIANLVALINMVLLSIFNTPKLFYICSALNGFSLAGYAGFKMVVIIQIVGMENQHSFIVLEQLIVIGASFLGPKLCVTLGSFSN